MGHNRLNDISKPICMLRASIILLFPTCSSKFVLIIFLQWMVLAQLRLRITSAILMSLSWVQTHLHTKVRKMSLRWDCTLWSLVQSRSAIGSKNLTAPPNNFLRRRSLQARTLFTRRLSHGSTEGRRFSRLLRNH